MTSQIKSTNGAGRAAASVPTDGAADGLGAMLEPSKMITDMAGAFGSGLLRLASRRLHAQAEYFEGLAGCRSVQEVMERQMEFLRRAGSEYGEQFGTLLQGVGPTGKDAGAASSTTPAA